MPVVVCYGDSNTYGYDAATGGRFPKAVRWPGVLAAELAGSAEVIEEGLNGRTTIWDDPYLEGRNGRTYLLPCLRSHAPVDVLVLMLGTNDLKTIFGRSAGEIAAGRRRARRRWRWARGAARPAGRRACCSSRRSRPGDVDRAGPRSGASARRRAKGEEHGAAVPDRRGDGRGSAFLDARSSTPAWTRPMASTSRGTTTHASATRSRRRFAGCSEPPAPAVIHARPSSRSPAPHVSPPFARPSPTVAGACRNHRVRHAGPSAGVETAHDQATRERASHGARRPPFRRIVELHRTAPSRAAADRLHFAGQRGGRMVARRPGNRAA